MRKLSNKGMSSIELLAAFVILVAIVIGLYDVILNYKNKQQIEAIRNMAIEYSNNLQKVIQDDLIKGHLTAVEGIDATYKQATFTMDRPSSYKTTIHINVDQNSISYGKTGEVVNYKVPEVNDLKIDPTSRIEVISLPVPYLKIHIILTHPNFEGETYDFTITCPIQYSD